MENSLFLLETLNMKYFTEKVKHAYLYFWIQKHHKDRGEGEMHVFIVVGVCILCLLTFVLYMLHVHLYWVVLVATSAGFPL